MRHVLRLVLLVLLLGVLLGGCRRRIHYHLRDYSQVYTQTNLHPDEHRGRLYSMNYQQDGLIPVCTPVDIQVVSRKKMVFTRLDNGRRYNYIFDKRLRGAIPAHLDKYFGPECPQQELNNLPPEDVAGVQNGEVYQNMTKRGVLFAAGYPPEHKTPTLQHDVWTYWKNRFNKFEIHFKYGKVVGIND